MASTTVVVAATSAQAAEAGSCGQKELPWRRLVLLAAMVCYTYCVCVYYDIIYGAEDMPTASDRLQFYLIASIFQFFWCGFMAYLIISTRSGKDETPSYDLEDVFPQPTSFHLTKAICFDLPLLLLVLLPFFFFLRVHADRPPSEWFLLALLYIVGDGVVLIMCLYVNDRPYWLLLSVLNALVCTPFTGFSPHHPRLLALKGVMTLLSVVTACLCGVVYVYHRRQKKRLLPPRPMTSANSISIIV